MSLVSEALKKARQEAARQDAVQRGIPYAVGSVDREPRRGLAAPLLTGLVAGAVLVGVAAVAAYVGKWGPWHKSEVAGEASQRVPGGGEGSEVVSAAQGPNAGAGPGAAGSSAPGKAAPGSAVPALPGGRAPVASAPGAVAPPGPRGEPALSPLPAEVAAAQGTATEAPSAAAQRELAARQAAQSSAPSVPPAAALSPTQPTPLSMKPPAPPVRVETPGTAPSPSRAPAAPVAAPSPPAGDSSDEKVYSGEVPIPGGGTLHLNGVAFSDHPVAVIDGRVVAPGEVVQGFTVVAIERGQVRLQGYGMKVIVAVR